MSEQISLVAGPEESGERVDAFLAGRLTAISRSRATELARAGLVQINGSEARAAQRVAAGDRVDVSVVPRQPLTAAPEHIPLRVVYRDRDLAVIDKPAGLVVHPAPGHSSGTLANALAGLFPSTRQVGTEERPGIVHRLDKDTSGLMVVALTPEAHASLQHQISSRSAGRRYLALVTGHLSPAQGTIDAPIGRDPRDRKRMAVYGVSARPARTSYRVLERLSGFDLIEATLHSGRTHQIRVHMAALGHPVVGDETYHGAPLPDLHRQFLHAYELSLSSPSTGEDLVFTSVLPDDLETVLQRLRRRVE